MGCWLLILSRCDNTPFSHLGGVNRQRVGWVLASLVGVWVWQRFHSPVFAMVAGVLVGVVCGGVGGGRWRGPVDGRRLFTPGQRAHIFARAGHRCEHKPWWWFRCPRSATHADHVHPHSRGGATSVGNGQALCAHHNLVKGARVPSRWEVWRLERRRVKYFPAGEPVQVMRR